jgi:hypothetical protein
MVELYFHSPMCRHDLAPRDNFFLTLPMFLTLAIKKPKEQRISYVFHVFLIFSYLEMYQTEELCVHVRACKYRSSGALGPRPS